MTIMVPWWGARGKSASYSITHFDYTCEALKVRCENSRLEINGDDFGTVAPGDLVDLRVLGEVYVNDVMRTIMRGKAQQVGADQPATALESKSEGNESTKPESEGRPK